MKAYQVRMPYYDDDHDHGIYESPLFLTRKDAEKFLTALRNLPELDSRRWFTCAGGDVYGPEKAFIREMEIVHWNGELKASNAYLLITYS